MEENSKKRDKYYFPESQKKYAEKCKFFHVKFLPSEKEISDKLESHFKENKISANSWIKQAIIEKMKREIGD